MERGRACVPTLPKAPKPLLSTGAMTRHAHTIRRFLEYEDEDRQLCLEQLLLYDTLPEGARDDLMGIIRTMKHELMERDKKWWRLPAIAYEDGRELRFFDTATDLRNVPLKKKKRAVLRV